MDRYRQSALKQANLIRKSLGLPKVDKLYPGSHRATSCPVSNTIMDDDWEDGVVSTLPITIQIYGGSKNYNLIYHNNSYTERFIERFDRGQYPDLCADGHAHEPDGTVVEVPSP